MGTRKECGVEWEPRRNLLLNHVSVAAVADVLLLLLLCCAANAFAKDVSLIKNEG